MNWHVYILECLDGRFYTGMTNNLERRLREHTAGRGGNFTRAFGVRKILYSEGQPTLKDAMRRELQIKRYPRARKLLLIEGEERHV